MIQTNVFIQSQDKVQWVNKTYKNKKFDAFKNKKKA